MTKTLKAAFLDEFEDEMISTRKILECAPDDKFAWRPHEKAFTLGKLMNHLAALPGIADLTIKKRSTRPNEAA